MYRRILVPLDGSEHSECALAHVKAIATGCKVPEVIVLFVVEPIYPITYEIPIEVAEDVKQRNEVFGKEYIERITRNLSAEGIAASGAIQQGRPAEVILDYARSRQVDLIIMSTRGRSGLSRWILGSVADRVARNSTAPVLLVPPAICSVEQGAS